MSIRKDLSAIIGDTETITATFTDDNGDAIDVSTYDFFFTLKTDYNVTDTNATIKKEPADFSISGAGSNVATVVLSDTETKIAIGTYVYDIQYKDASGKITTFAIGDYVFSNEVTIRTS